MIESNNKSTLSENQIQDCLKLPLLYHSISDLLLYKTRYLTEIKASQNEQLNKLSLLEQSTTKRKLELEKRIIKYEEYGEKIQNNRLT